MNKLYGLLCLTILFHYHCYSQAQSREKTDSLLSVLSTAKEDSIKVNTLNEIVSSFRYSNTDSALHYSNMALALATKLNYKIGIADVKRKMGALYADLGNFEEGFKSANEALLILNKLLLSATGAEKESIKRKIGSTYNVLGHNTISKGNFPEGLKYSFLALKVREEIGDKQGIADTEYNIGNIYSSQGNYSEALKHYEISLKQSMEIGNKKDIPWAHNTIAWVYISQGNFSEALKRCNVALKLAEEINDEFILGQIYSNLGVIYENQGNYSDALKFHLNALKIYERTGNNESLPFIYNLIGNVYTKQKKYKEASLYLNNALSMSIKTGSLEHIKYSFENWAKLDSARGNYKSAFEHYKLAIVYRDSLLNKENSKKTVQQQMQYDFDKKEAAQKAEQEKKDALSLKELQKQKLVRDGFIGGFAFVLVFAGVFFIQRNKIKKGKRRSDELLLNILPEEVAEELKSKGSADAKQFDEVTVMFTDFKGFTQISEKLTPAELVAEIHTCFKAFDNIITKYNIEKIKTIGDAYMCAGGLPVANKTNATDVVNAAIEIQQFMQQHLLQRKREGKEVFEIRIGIHSGPVVAGIVGVKKFAYDIWGDTVNIASRMESSGEAGKVNISGSTFELVKDKFYCAHRGKIQAKNKGEIDMYFVEIIS
jgi:adenylate cyclase